MPQIDLDKSRNVPIAAIIGQRVELRRRGRYCVGCCPFHDDRTPSLHVYTDSNRYWCFGCGAGGDAIDFVMRYDGVDFVDAIAAMEGGAIRRRQSRPVAKVPKASDTQKRALAIWNQAARIEDSPAEQYLESRGLPLADLPGPLPLRFDYLWHPETKDRHPTLISAVCNLDGEVTGIQRTYLQPDGRKLSEVAAKLSLGSLRGSATQLGQPTGRLIICEGLEDGLSLRRELPEIPVWVAAGASNMGRIHLPDSCMEITIAADNDEAGRTAAERAAAAFQQMGKTARIFQPSPQFKDFNEQIQKGRPQ